MRRAPKGTPSSNPAQDRPLCQPKCWQQYHPTRDVAESLSAAPRLVVSGTGLHPPSFGQFGGGTPCAPHPGVLVVAGWDFTAPGGLRGLGRQQERLQRAGATARVRPKEPQEGKGVKAGKSWGEIFLQGESGVKKPRPELSCPGRLCSLCSHGNRSDALLAWLFSQFIFKGSSCLRRGAFRQPLAGEEQGSAGGTGGKAAAALGEHYLIGTAGEPHKWQHQQTPAPRAGRLW